MTARVAPGGWRELGVVNWLAVRVLSRAAGTRDAALFSALGRHRRLFRGWLGFAAQLMPFGRLPAAERELVILRVAALRGCAYEWRHHERLGLRAGLSAAEVASVAVVESLASWRGRRRVLLEAVDAVACGRMTDACWSALSAELSEVERVELCMLVAHYVMLSLVVSALGLPADP